MGRPRKATTPEQRLSRLLARAVGQGLINIAAELREVLDDLERRQKSKPKD
jgi:hypothetical protein